VAKKREVRLRWRYDEGHPHPDASPSGPSDLELTIGAGDAADLFRGRSEASVSFMRGRLKAAGDGSLLLAFLESTATPGFDSWRDRALGLAEAGTLP
jgi:hypothetical protein